MKLVSFVRLGKTGFGAWTSDGLIDLTGRIASEIASIKSLLAAGRVLEAIRYVDGRKADFRLSDVTLLPVIPDASKILCVGLNYETHRTETNRPKASHPTIFTRYADSQIAHGQPLIKPHVSDMLDYEGELAVIIGQGGRYISEADAMQHVAGYSSYNDGTVRDWQRHTHQFTPGKTFPGTGGAGPWLVTADEISDYTTLSIRTFVNGELRQQAGLDELIFPIAQLISYCSSFTPLQPGDIILTGTPGGVGDRRDPPIYLKAGDVVTIEIDRVGTLINSVIAEE